MLDINIAEIGENSGELNDGVVRGGMNRSQLIASYNNLLLSTNIHATRKDTGTTGTYYTDISADAVADVDDQFLPWGDNSSFGLNDELWISDDDKNVNKIYVHITTPGVWDGDGLEVMESTDGETLVSVQNLVDNTDGFRAAAGVYEISFLGNTNRAAIAPEFGATKRQYLVIRPKNLTAKTTSPKIKHVWMVDSTSNAWHDFTDITNESLTNSTFDTATMFPLVGSESRFGFSGLTTGVYDAVYRGIPSVYTVSVEYLATDNTWKEFTDYVDESNNFTDVSTTHSSTPTYFYRRWSIPTDWGKKTLTLAPSTTPIEAYWCRRIIDAVSAYGPISIYEYRRRSLSFGTGLAYGMYHKASTNYTHVTFDIGQPSSTAVVIAFTNAITGQSRNITIPANTVSSGTLTGGRLDFPSTLNIGAGEMLIINYVSGGTLRDVELHLAKE